MDIKNKSQFIEYFSKGIKSQNNLKIGVEHERFLFEGENKKRISYETLKKLFENLKVNGWESLYEKKNIIGMQRDNQQITTEPGLQCELSGAPLENIHQVCSESSKFLKEIETASKGLNINTVSIGFDPFNNLSDIPQSPKSRYKIMTKEMPRGGKQSLEMMYRTCGIQINYDYTSEENFEKIFRLGNYLTPLTIALYSNSPFESGKPVGYYSYRNKVWQNTSRGGIMPIAFEKVNFEKYFDHVIEYPILFAIREKNYIEPNGQPFKDFILGNFSNLKDEASLQDFETHLATIFTEVRLKQFIEVRSLDACDWECLCDGPAFFTGIFYKGLDEAFEIAMKWKKENVMNAYLESPKKGLETELEGKKLHEWGNIFFDIAKRGLIEREQVNSKGNDETVYLKHVENVIKNKKNRAQLLLDQYKKTNNLDFFKNEKENFNDHLKTIHKQISQIENLVNEFSDFARMPKPTLKKTNLLNIIKENLNLLNEIDKTIEIKVLNKTVLNLLQAKLILIRSEPPFNQQYINTTFILEHISKKVRIINHPKALREVPEKLFSLRLTKYMPQTLISENLNEIKTFLKSNKKIVMKPIESYSGNDVKLITKFNKSLINKFIKKYHHLMFQKFIPQI